MTTRAELHFHILPGVDDGPATMDESLELARLAVADGTGTVVATPHVRLVDVAEIPGWVDAVQRRLDEERIPLELRCGGELAHDDVAGLSDRDLDSIAHGPDGARWVLLEAPLPGTGATAEEFIAGADELRARGFGVLVGHPERADVLFEEGDDAPALRRERALGSPLQVNASSLVGDHGQAAKRRALALCRRGEVAVISSDAHRPTRGPRLVEAVRALVEGGMAAADADDLTQRAPRALLERGIPARA
jgi:protein-tyrosine phosphatase